MKYSFCPNISLPEHKKRIKEIGVDKFYQEYYEQNFLKDSIPIAPNGNPSKLYNSLINELGLSHLHAKSIWNKTQTQEFKDWFKDSKVVDENGEPLIVYHRSNKSSIDNFKNDEDLINRGFYFSTKDIYAKNYGKYVYPSFLNIQNPLITNNLIRTSNVITNQGDQIRNSKDFLSIEVLKRLKKDGIINLIHDEIVVLDSNQIKSINNKGSFSNSDNIYYDINPESSVMNQLFVDIDKFTDYQQKEIINSIKYQLEQAKLEGINNVSTAFDYTKDVFENQLESLRELPDQEEWGAYTTMFQNIVDNFDRFKEFTITDLSRIGVRVTEGSFNEDFNENEDTETPDTEDEESKFNMTEGTFQRDNYDDNFTFSRSSKDTASAHLKNKLSFIPDVELVDGNLQPKENFLFLPTYMSLDKVWSNLLRELTPLNQDEIFSRLNELSKENPMYGEIINQIFSDPNTSIQNEFLVTFSKQQAQWETIKIGVPDSAGNISISVFGTNRQNAENIIIENWIDKLLSSPLVNYNNGEATVDTERAKIINTEFKNLVKNFDKNNIEDIKHLSSLLSVAGVQLTDSALDNLAKFGIRDEGVKKGIKEYLESKVSLIFDRLAGNIKEDTSTLLGDDDSSKFNLNNPFISEASTVNQLAKLELKVNPSIIEDSFIDGTGKAKYSYVNNSYISKLFKTLNSSKADEFIKGLSETTYAKDSIWLNKLKNDPKFKEVFKLTYLDTLGTFQTKQKGKLFKMMSTKEKEFTRIGLFQNQGRSNNTIGKFIALIPSDKTTLPIITTLKTKVVINLENYKIKNHEALDALYTGFTSEYNRILDVQKQQADPSLADKLIQDYHTGAKMGEKFLIYDFLNGNKELFDENGKLKLVDAQTLENIITPQIQDFIAKSIKEQLAYWKSLGIDPKIILDKSYKKNLDYEDNNDKIRAMTADYVVNNFLFNLNYTQVISGDPALFAKGTVAKTWINYSKRLAKDIAPGLDGNFTNPYYRTIFLKDLKFSSKHLAEYREAIGNKVEGSYDSLNPADAQEYTTLKEHLAVMEAYGKLTPELREAGNRLMAGGDSPADIKLILQPVKPVQVGSIPNTLLGINTQYYIKTSSFPLVPALTKGLEIDKLRVAMETPDANGNTIDRAVYESGVKLGLQGNIQSIMNPDGSFNDNIVNNAVTLDRNIFRIQMELPYHAHDNTINEGSQARKLILSDVYDKDILNLFGHELSGRAAKQLYEGLHVEKINRSFNKLINDIGATRDDKGKLRIQDLNKLQKVLIEEATSRNYNINDVYGLQIEEVNGKQRFKIPLGFNNSSNRLESILNALVTNRVIKQELPGFSKIQGSSAGFTRIKGIEGLDEVTRDNIVWLNKDDTTLNYIRHSEDKKTLLQADILLPSWFKDDKGHLIDIKQFINEDGNLDTSKIPEELLTNIGIRIPTQGYGSMMSFKVKGFLPVYVGDLAIVPSEIVAQMGSDFDVDKLFHYRYEYTYDGNKFKKVNPNIKVNEGEITTNISKLSDQQINNAIIQFYEDRYKDPTLLNQILEPNGFGNLIQLNNIISSKLGLNKQGHFFLPATQNSIHKSNGDGKAGTGVFSLFSTFIRASQDAGLTLATPLEFKINNKIEKFNILGAKTASRVISYFQSASVDNAKEQLLSNLNINPTTMDVVGTMGLIGLDEDYISYFVSQPIIREYVNELANINDITNPTYNPNKEGQIYNDLLRKYLGIGTINEDTLETALGDEVEAVYSVEDLNDQLTNSDKIKQAKILIIYNQVKSLAKSIRGIQSAINIDTGGLGVKFSNLQVKQNQIALLQENQSIVGIENLYNNNTISAARDVLGDSVDMFSQILPYNTREYVSITQSIVEDMGKADKEINADDLQSIYNHIKSYIYSEANLLNLDDINSERESLLFTTKGNKSLGDRWEDYAKSPAGKKNILAQRILTRRGTNTADPVTLEALNTPAANQSDNNEAMAAFYRMYYKGTEVERNLAEDLVKYYILTGGQQSSSSISKYIPYDILEESDFSDKLNQINNDLNTGDYSLYNGLEQYFQHNPSKAIMPDLKKVGVIQSKDKQYLTIPKGTYDVITTKRPGEEVYYRYPNYLSTYDQKLKNFLLYKLDTSTEVGADYLRIDTLGSNNILEYNAGKTQYSLLKANQAGTVIPISQNTGTTGNSVVYTGEANTTNEAEQLDETRREQATPAVIDEDYLAEELSINNKGIGTTLNRIITNPQTEEIANIAKDLSKIIVNYPNLKIGTFTYNNVSGNYYDNKIGINLNNILKTNSENSLEKAQQVILHETLHAITVNKIDNYDNLSDTDKKLVDRLTILYNQYKRSVNQEDLTRFQEIGNRIINGKYVDAKDNIFYIQNKQNYYALENVKEFIAAGLTDNNFTKQLKNNNFWTKVWDTISNLLGLNKAYNNDYEALYDTAISLGSNIDTNTSNDVNNDLNPTISTPREQKQEFLSKYNKKDGQPISLESFNKINSSVKANSKYSNIRLDAPYENGKRVLRVYTKGGTPLYDVNPEQGKPKTKEEKFIETTLSRLQKLKSRFENSTGYKDNLALQAKVAGLNQRIAAIQEENSTSIIINDANNKLGEIEARITNGQLLNKYDVSEFENYLTFYQDIKSYITFNEAFEDENKELDSIERRSKDLLNRLQQNKKDLLVSFLNSRIDVAVDINDLLSSPQLDAGTLESMLQSGAFSTNKVVQLLQSIIEDTQMITNEEFSEQEHAISSLVKEFLAKYKNYDILLQKDFLGNNTGRLTNKYSQSYYDELAKLKGDKKAYAKFFKSNTKVELRDEGKESWNKDLSEIKELYPEWNKEGTHDKAAYTQFYASHDPYSYIKDYDKGIFRKNSQASKYISKRPIDKWLDPNYTRLKHLPEDDVARQLYDLLDAEFRPLNQKYENQVNYIPEISKGLIGHLIQGNLKGGFDKIHKSIIDSLFSTVEAKKSNADLDINGEPHPNIPVYMMSDNMNPSEKSYDLGSILLAVKAQEAALKHKTDVEPYLIMLKEVAQTLPEYKTTQSGEIQLDENDQPITSSSAIRNANMNDQMRWIVEDYLYNKGSKQSNFVNSVKVTQKSKNTKGEDVVTEKVLTGSKISDTISAYTRLKGMGLNSFSGIGNIVFGIISNTVYSGDRTAFGEGENIKALGVMLNASIPGTSMYTKVAKLMTTFDVLVQTNEIRYGQFKIKNTENPLGNLSWYEFQKRGEYFVQGQTAMAMLINKRVKDVSGTEYSLFDAFDDKGNWNTEKFGENPYDDRRTKLNMIKEIRDVISNVHGDYSRGLKIKEHWLGRAMLVFRTWIPQSVANRFGKEYTDIKGVTHKGRYRSYELQHAAILPFIRDAYKAFVIDRGEDTIDTRNLRKNAIELAFIPILWGAALIMRSMITGGEPDKDNKALITALINLSTRAQSDLTFFYNPYSFKSVIREPIPAFKTLMDIYDIGPAVIDALEGKDTYKSGRNRGKSKLYTKLKKAFPIVNQPDKILAVTSKVIDNGN